MKLSSILLTLAASTSVYSKTTEFLLFSEKEMANDDAYDNSRAPLLNKVSKECREDLVKDNIYIDCFNPPVGRMNLNNAPEKCALFVSEKCNKFNMDPLSVVPRCANDETFKLILPYISIDQAKKNINCYRNDKDEYCPSAVKTLIGGYIDDKDVHETCKSAVCTERLIEIFEIAKNGTMEYYRATVGENLPENFDLESSNKVLAEYVDFLKSQNCTSQAVDDRATVKYFEAEKINESGAVKTNGSGAGKTSESNDDKTSGSSTLKPYGIIFTISSLILTYFL